LSGTKIASHLSGTKVDYFPAVGAHQVQQADKAL
jgi:hypothetical protein